MKLLLEFGTRRASRSLISRRGGSLRISSEWIRPGTPRSACTVAPIVAPSNLANFEPLIRKRTADVA